MRNMPKYALGIGIIYCMVCLFDADAQIGVEPVRQEIKGSQRERLGGIYTIYNTGKEAVDVTVEKRDWFVLPENTEISAKDWLKVSPSSFHLEGREHKVVRYRVVVPKEAIGELICMIFFTYREPNSPIIQTRFGVSLYVQIVGTEVFKSQILDFDINKIIVPDGKVPPYLCAKLRIDNQGNVHVRPKGKVEITDRKGNRVASADLVYGYPVYPGDDRVFIGKYESGILPTGKYIAYAKIEFDNTTLVLEEKLVFKVNKIGKVTKVGDRHDWIKETKTMPKD